MTIDDKVLEAQYNNFGLPITGTLNNWSEEKTISFYSCDVTNPGKLSITGFDNNSVEHCSWGGLLLHCTASDQTSPWHNFKTDMDHWRVENGNELCSNNEGMMGVNPLPEFMQKLREYGAKKIWANRQKVTLIGSPLPAGKKCRVCDQCKEGYEGAKCDYCKNGYSKGNSGKCEGTFIQLLFFCQCISTSLIAFFQSTRFVIQMVLVLAKMATKDQTVIKVKLEMYTFLIPFCFSNLLFQTI